MKALSFSIIMVFVSLILFSCQRKSIPFLEVDKPLWYSNEYTSDTLSDSTLFIVSYNILRGKEMEKAIHIIKGLTTVGKADILLFQEVSEEDVIYVSEILRLNYVYVPISQNIKTGKNFGNAILSKYQLGVPTKVILPNEKIINKGRRVGTISNIQVSNTTVGIASVHLETMVMPLDKRVEQLDALLESIESSDVALSHIIIGGDFNTFFKKDKKTFNALLGSLDYNNMTPNYGHTAESIFGLVKSRLDYIYCKGCQCISSGIGPESEASDHRPIYSVVKLFD